MSTALPQVASSKATRPMLLLATAGAAPFVAGQLVTASDAHDATGVPLPCPFRAATGLPCPLCGASRAFVALAQGSPDVLHYNAALVLIAGAVLLAGVLGLLFPKVGRRLGLLSRRTIVLLVLSAATLSWTWALLHRNWIVG